jgi:hypothetical protein
MHGSCGPPARWARSAASGWRGARRAAAPARRRCTADGRDLVFRTGVGMAWGAFALPCAVLALSVWLQAFLVHDEADPHFRSLLTAWVLGAILPGAALGGVWFGCDLPWLRR